MTVGEVYIIHLGKYSDKYLCVAISHLGRELKRVRHPKSKIDAIRLPQSIMITAFAKAINQ